MEAALAPVALRKLTRSLACLAKFGETVTLLALPSELVLTSLSASKTAHGKAVFSADFFDEYALLPGAPRRGLTCDLNIKALLGVLRIRAGEKLEACHLRLHDQEQMVGGLAAAGRSRSGTTAKRRRIGRDSDDESEGYSDGEDQGARVVEQPRFSIKLSFPGFVKQHALQISTPPPTGSPVLPHLGSHFTTSAVAVLDWMESFPSWSHGAGGGTLGGGSGQKEEFLAWAFRPSGVKISSWAANAKADQLSTEFFVDQNDFESYYLSPSFSSSAERDQALGFPMREFKAVTLLAQALALPLFTRFDKPFSPLFVTLPSSANDEDDGVFAFEFLIMTRDVPSAAAGVSSSARQGAVKAEKAAAKDGSGRRGAGAGGRRLMLESGGPSEGGSGRSQHEGEEDGMDVDHSKRSGRPDTQGDTADDGEQGGAFDYAPPDGDAEEDPHASAGPSRPRASHKSRRVPSSSPHRPADGQSDMTFSHPIAHSTARPRPAELTNAEGSKEPLFYPGSQPPRSQIPMTQLTQAQLEDLGLGDLDAVDFGIGDEEEWEVAGDVAGDGAEDGGAVGGTQIAQTQMSGVGRAYTRFEGGESDDELDEADVTTGGRSRGASVADRTQEAEGGSGTDEDFGGMSVDV